MNTREIIKLIDAEGYTSAEENEFSTQLFDGGYATSLEAVDGSEQLKARHLISGQRFFQDYNESEEKDQDYLLMACECASYAAMIERINLNCGVVKSPDTIDDEKSNALEQISEDCSRLGNLYWSAGYIYASRVYLDIGNYYSKSQEDGSGALARMFHEEAVKNYHRADLLLEHEPSKKLMRIIYQGKGIAACGWASHEAAKRDLFAHIDSTRNKTLLTMVEDEVSAMLHNGNHKPLELKK